MFLGQRNCKRVNSKIAVVECFTQWSRPGNDHWLKMRRVSQTWPGEKEKKSFWAKGTAHAETVCRLPQNEKAVVVGQWRAMADSAKRMVAVVMAWCKLQTDIPVFLHDIMMVCTLLWVSSVLNTHTKPDSWRANKVWYE